MINKENRFRHLITTLNYGQYLNNSFQVRNVKIGVLGIDNVLCWFNRKPISRTSIQCSLIQQKARYEAEKVAIS